MAMSMSMMKLGAIVGTTLGLAACGNDPRSGRLSGDETSLTTYASCAALEADLKDMLDEEVTTRMEQIRKGGYGPVAEDTAQPGAAPVEGVDYSGTNNQEAGVDEADFVKTDGTHIYVLNGTGLRIFGVPQFGQLVPESRTQIEGYPSELLLDKDAARLAVFSRIVVQRLPVDHPLRASLATSLVQGWRVAQAAKLTVLDVADAAHPRVVREIYLEGDYSTARFVAGSARMAGYTWLDFPSVDAWVYGGWNGNSIGSLEREARAHEAVAALTLEELVPRLYERRADGTIEARGLTNNACRSFHRPSDSTGRGVTSILTVDLRADDLRFDADQIITNYGTLYASTDSLYIVEPANDWWWYWWSPNDQPKTNIHQFDFAGTQTHYVASGRVRGTVRDSFSLSEKDGYLRAAATTMAPSGRIGSQGLESHLYVLAPTSGRLVTVGRLDGIAPDEALYTSRFVGDRAYFVTARYVDPLITIDLADPEAPALLGELAVPGVSMYLQSIAPGRLLAIGYGGNENSIDWSRNQISLFDVTDDAHAALLDTTVVGAQDGWTYSEASYEHKAFQYWEPKGLLAIPVSSYFYGDTAYGWTYRYQSELRLFSVGDASLALYGTIDHGRFYDSDPSIYWQNTDIRRSIFMGDFVYAVSDRAITAHRIDDLAEVAAQPLDGTPPNIIYYWGW